MDACISWRHHHIKTLSVWLALCEGNPPVTGGFPFQRASCAGFCIFIEVSQNKQLNKHRSCPIVTSPQWFQRFGGGYVNNVYHCCLEEDVNKTAAVVVRVYGDCGTGTEMDRNKEIMMMQVIRPLTYWGLNKVVIHSQAHFHMYFLELALFDFYFSFDSTIKQHWVLNRLLTITRSRDDIIQWHIYSSLNLNGLI